MEIKITAIKFETVNGQKTAVRLLTGTNTPPPHWFLNSIFTNKIHLEN